jgi:hypothetical protein
MTEPMKPGVTQEPLSAADAIAKDIGRKCAEDVGAPIRRNMALMTDQRGAFMVAAYGAAAAIGAVTGAFAALADDLPEPNEKMVDEMWRDFLRPLALGYLPEGVAR